MNLPEDWPTEGLARPAAPGDGRNWRDLKGRKNINLTDHDARFMKTRQGFLPAYNAQAMVSPVRTGRETSGMLVTAVQVVDEPADYARLIPMLQRTEETTGVRRR